MLAQALVAEADAFVALWKDSKLPDGRDRVLRHGHGPHRAIQTGVGPVEVRRAKVRDRGEVSAEEKIRFTSSILPKWARERIAGWGLHPLESAALSRRTPDAVIARRQCRYHWKTVVSAASFDDLIGASEQRSRHV